MSYEEPVPQEISKTNVPEIPSTPEERSSAMLAHILGTVTGFIGPLIFYATKKDSAFVQDQSKEALNFHLTMMIAHIIGSIPCGAGLIITYPISIVFSIIGGMAANKGEVYRYPFRIQFIK
jgi:uncharacterized Tic20 family protein